MSARAKTADDPLLLTPQAARCYRIERALRRMGCLRFDELRALVGVSAATLKRDMQCMRQELDAPLRYDAWANGYRLDPSWPGLLVKVEEEALHAAARVEPATP